jgi:hypothetical protein
MGDASAILFQDFINTLESAALRTVAHHWQAVRGGRLAPNWSDLSSPALSPYFKQLWGFQYDPLSGDFTGRLAGKNIVDWIGANFWGASLKEIHPPHIFQETHQLLSRVVGGPAVLRSSGRLFSVGGKTVLGERIALPLASDGKNCDAILGASDYDCPPLSGPIELIHENIEWFAL